MDVDKQRRDLFAGDKLRVIYEHRSSEIADRIDRLKEYEFGSLAEDDLIDDILKNRHFGTVTVRAQATKRVRSESWEGGHFVLFEVPVEGNIQLLSWQPEVNSPDNPMTGAIQETNSISVAFAGQTVEEIHKQVQAWAGVVLAAADSLSEEARNYDRELLEFCYRQLEAKLNRPLARREVIESIPFRLERDTEAVTTLTVSEHQAMSRRKDYRDSDKAHSLQYFITREDYDRIMRVLDQTTEVIARMPVMAPKLKDGDLRNALLIALNRHYKGSPTSEVFTCLGKTDIVVRYEGANVFFALCENWKGTESMTEIVDDILDYVTWQDTRTAAIVFNRKGDFTTVLAQIDEVMRSHPNYAKTAEPEPPTMRRYIFYTVVDPERTFDLTVLAVDLPFSAK
jgi:hypothetical protein